MTATSTSMYNGTSGESNYVTYATDPAATQTSYSESDSNYNLGTYSYDFD